MFEFGEIDIEHIPNYHKFDIDIEHIWENQFLIWSGKLRVWPTQPVFPSLLGKSSNERNRFYPFPQLCWTTGGLSFTQRTLSSFVLK